MHWKLLGHGLPFSEQEVTPPKGIPTGQTPSNCNNKIFKKILVEKRGRKAYPSKEIFKIQIQQ
jgi:hypothetical protein